MIALPIVEGVEFRLHPEFPDYAVGDDGSVWSSKYGSWCGRTLQMCGEQVFVGLNINGVTYNRFVHRLVLEAFIGPCPEGMECCHWDGDPQNNRLGNLRWDTHQSNERDKERHGTIPCGEDCSWSKITEAQVLQIKEEFASGQFTQQELADKYGVKKGVISDVIRCKTWKHLTQPGELEYHRTVLAKLHKRGGRNSNARLTENNVREIRRLYDLGYRQVDLAEMFSITQGAITKIVNRKTWAYVA